MCSARLSKTVATAVMWRQRRQDYHRQEPTQTTKPHNTSQSQSPSPPWVNIAGSCSLRFSLFRDGSVHHHHTVSAYFFLRNMPYCAGLSFLNSLAKLLWCTSVVVVAGSNCSRGRPIPGSKTARAAGDDSDLHRCRWANRR